jgi:hypothetical protein
MPGPSHWWSPPLGQPLPPQRKMPIGSSGMRNLYTARRRFSLSSVDFGERCPR